MMFATPIWSTCIQRTQRLTQHHEIAIDLCCKILLLIETTVKETAILRIGIILRPLVCAFACNFETSHRALLH